MTTRRQFLQLSAAVGAGLAVGERFLDPRLAWAFYQSPGTPGGNWPGMQKFIQPLRGVGLGGIPIAGSDGLRRYGTTNAIHYSLRIAQFEDNLHPALGSTRLWGYHPATPLGGGTQPQKHLGGIIVAQKGVPIQLTLTNRLPDTHILPVDTSANFEDAAVRFGGSGHNATTTHLHGGLVPWISDGGPETWFTPAASGGKYGPSTKAGPTGNIYKILNPNLQPGQAEYYYPNNQSARLGWYHDHAHDITRLNAYAGIASAYVIRDAFEGNLRNLGLPDFIENGGRELPIVIQDKIFVGPDLATKDPTWPGPRRAGSLWYPHVYEPERWEQNPQGLGLPHPSVIPEMFGDTMLANGTVYPEATVEARRYRLRILNACQARFLNLQLYVDDGSRDGVTLHGIRRLPGSLRPTNAKGPDFLVLGTEGGFLPRPVVVNSARPLKIATDANTGVVTVKGGSLITAPGERLDVVVDFSGFAGKRIILYNDAPAPFPSGDDRNDYFPDNPNNPTQTLEGFGPNTRQILRFNIVPATSADGRLALDPATNLKPGLDPFIVPPGVAVQQGVLHLPHGIPVRQLTLNEDFDSFGRLIQFLGTNQAPGSDPAAFGRPYMATPTETPRAGATEVWQIANLTADTHPIHFHLVNVQLLGRQPFAGLDSDGVPVYTGAASDPDPTERGWKETVRMNPGEVTTVVMRFDLPQVPFVVPSSPRTGGHEYVWHCHILEHEEHDMMRPLVIT